MTIRRKFLSLCLTWALSVSAMGMQLPQAIQASAVTVGTGDLNGDQAVDLADASLLQAWLVKRTQRLPLLAQADLNADGTVNVLDLCLLKRRLSVPGTPAQGYAGLVLNEVCSSNKNAYKDSNGASPDWLELYNGSGKAIDLSGVGLSEGNKNRYKFQFPEGTILRAGAYCLVACDKAQTTEGIAFVAPFNLSASGETLYLTAPAMEDGTHGAEIDTVSVPALTTDVTYGRFPNGTGSFAYLSPSPEAANTTLYEEHVDAPLFSSEAGFYDTAFDLTLTAGDTSRIYYTTDGSDPTTSKTAKLYAGSIRIYDNTSAPNVWSAIRDITLYEDYYVPGYSVDKGIVVRAVCADSTGRYSDVVTNTYFVGKTAAYYKNLKVVSLATDPENFFDNETGIYMVGNRYYNWKAQNPNVNKKPYQPDNPTNYNQEGREWERPVNLQVFEQGKAVYSVNVGARIAGNASRCSPQKSLKFYARSEYGASSMKYTWVDGLQDVYGNKIKSFDKIMLRNSSNDWYDLHLRDTINQKLGEGRAYGTQGQQHCVLFLDGEFWGMYEITERQDENYVASHYGVDSKNCTIYKIGDTPEGVVEDYVRFYEKAMTLDFSKEENYAYFLQNIDEASFMDFFIFNTYICNMDWLLEGEGLNNWAMWRADTPDDSNSYADGRWRYFVYDTEMSTNLYGVPTTAPNYDLLGNLNRTAAYYNPAPLFYKVMENEGFRQRFAAAYASMIQNNFQPTEAVNLIRTMHAETQNAIFDSNSRFANAKCNGSIYTTKLNGLIDFFQKRPVFAQNHLNALIQRYSSGITPGITVDNKLTNASNWKFYTTQNAEGSGYIFSADAQMVVSQRLGNAAHAISCNYNNLGLAQGRKYKLQFTASCDAGTGKILAFIGDQVTYETYILETVSVTTTPQTFTFYTNTLPAVKNPNYLTFQYGIETGTYHVTDISVTEVS